MQNPRFTVPTLDKIPNPSVETGTAGVKEWITLLPFADLNTVTRSVIEALSLLNRHPEKVSARAEVMALYRAPCGRLLRVTPDQPNTPSSTDMRQLMTEMAYGYKHLVNEALSQRSWLKNRKRLLQAVYFATKYLTLEQFLAFEAYDCKASNSWRETLALYRLAEEQNLLRDAVEDKDQPDPANATVSHLLKRILLLKLLDPCHMMPEEARACFDYFNLWASEATVESLGENGNSAGRYLLDLEGREAPRPPDPDSEPQDPERFRYFNVLGVSKRAHHQLRQVELKGASAPDGLQRLRNLSAEQILKRILQAWHGRQERRNERTEAFGWMLCGCGLSSVTHFLQQLPDHPVGPDSGLDEELTLEQQANALNNMSALYTRQRCRQINKSTAGICLRLQIPGDADIQVGQVLLLQEDLPTGEGEWYAGIVRRLMRIDAGNLEAGIQFIRGVIKPIGIRARVDNHQDGHFQPALWINRGNERLNSVLVPRGLYQRGRELLVEQEEPAAMIQADQLIDSSPSFERFRYKIRET